MADAISRYYATNVSKRFLSVNRVYGRHTLYVIDFEPVRVWQPRKSVLADGPRNLELFFLSPEIFTPDIRGGVLKVYVYDLGSTRHIPG